MLRERTVQRDYWDVILPDNVRRMSPELEAVDGLLDDERFLEPFRVAFPAKRGRPTIPMEVYLRLMYLKFRYKLGYEALVAEVSNNISWRLFCRIGLSGDVPEASTLCKLTKGRAKAAVATLNDALLTKLVERGTVKGRRVRSDTTVLPANIVYPTDIALLADGLRVTERHLGRLHKLGGTLGATVEAIVKRMAQSRVRVKEQLRRLSQQLKQKDRPAGVRQAATKLVMEEAEQVCSEVSAVVGASDDSGDKTVGRERQAVRDGVTVLQRLVEQTKQVLGGDPHVKNRVVSVFDQEARPIRKGKLDKPTECGRVVRLDQSDDGYITGYQVHVGNPGDAGQVIPAVEHHVAVFRQAPQGFAGDRGMASTNNDRQLARLGVQTVSLPRAGPLDDQRVAVEQEPAFQELKKWRAGIEGLISLMKRVFGWARCLFKGTPGAEAWVDWSVLAHNLRRYGRSIGRS
jgi:IS5 family transposase